MTNKPKWRYDPAEHRIKHCWHKPEADFVKSGSHIHGKCPNTLTKMFAESLLVDAVHLPVEIEGSQPSKLWTVHEGVIYEAVPSGPDAFHGYPWCSRPGMNRLPRQIQKALVAMAEKKGYTREYKDWMKKHG